MQVSHAEHLTEFSEPLAESTSGFSIFSDIARPLRHVSVRDVRDSAEPDHGNVINVRLARPRALNEQTAQLVARRYAGRGYTVAAAPPDPNIYTFAAFDGGELVGTLGMRFDSDVGLAAQNLYPEEIGALRSSQRRLCEFTRLAVDVQTTSKEVLGALFHSCYLYAHVVRRLTHAVIEVNPRHAVFYRRVLHFKQIGEERHNRRVDAPAVLLALDFNVISRELTAFFSDPNWRTRTRSFFVHWFSPQDAAGILGRLRMMGEASAASD